MAKGIKINNQKLLKAKQKAAKQLLSNLHTMADALDEAIKLDLIRTPGTYLQVRAVLQGYELPHGVKDINRIFDAYHDHTRALVALLKSLKSVDETTLEQIEALDYKVKEDSLLEDVVEADLINSLSAKITEEINKAFNAYNSHVAQAVELPK